MLNSVKINNLSFYNDNGTVVLSAKQYDTGRKFIFKIIDNDEPFDLTGCSVYLRILKADGTQFQGEDCCLIEGNAIIIDTSIGNGEQILTTDGRNICELHLSDNNGLALTTWNFYIDVTERVFSDDGIASIDSWDAWDKVKNTADDFNRKLEEHYFVLTMDKDTANGVPSLDENTKVPISELYEATTTNKGITQLEDSVSSDSTTTAATPNSVKIVNDELLSEVTRAKNVEKTIFDKLETEVTRSTTAENNLDSNLNTKLNISLKGSINGLAELDESGKVPSSQLPSYVDDVLEGIATGATINSETNAISATGFILNGQTTECTPESGKIYLDTTSNIQFRWSGSIYISTGSFIALGETSSTAYRGDRGKIAYEHSQAVHAPSNAEKNVIVGIQKNGVDLEVDAYRKVNIELPEKAEDVGALPEDGIALKAYRDSSGNIFEDTYALKSALTDAGINSHLIGDNLIPSKITFADLVSKTTVTFFTNTTDGTNFPREYGSGVMIPQADTRYRSIYYISGNYAYIGHVTVASNSIVWKNIPNQDAVVATKSAPTYDSLKEFIEATDTGASIYGFRFKDNVGWTPSAGWWQCWVQYQNGYNSSYNIGGNVLLMNSGTSSFYHGFINGNATNGYTVKWEKIATTDENVTYATKEDLQELSNIVGNANTILESI